MQEFASIWAKSDPLIERLKPRLRLVGSIAEDTRLVVANELDFNICFEAWKLEPPFEVRKEDPLHLYKSGEIEGMDKLFYEGKFDLLNFKTLLLETAERSLNNLFENGNHPSSLSRFLTNEEFQTGDCSNCDLKAGGSMRHCLTCLPAVTQTRVGISMQLQWVVDERRLGWRPKT